MEKQLQEQLAETDARRRCLDSLRLDVAAARDDAAKVKAAEAAIRNEAAQFVREKLDLEVCA